MVSDRHQEISIKYPGSGHSNLFRLLYLIVRKAVLYSVMAPRGFSTGCTVSGLSAVAPWVIGLVLPQHAASQLGTVLHYLA